MCVSGFAVDAPDGFLKIFRTKFFVLFAISDRDVSSMSILEIIARHIIYARGKMVSFIMLKRMVIVRK